MSQDLETLCTAKKNKNKMANLSKREMVKTDLNHDLQIHFSILFKTNQFSLETPSFPRDLIVN